VTLLPADHVGWAPKVAEIRRGLPPPLWSLLTPTCRPRFPRAPRPSRLYGDGCCRTYTGLGDLLNLGSLGSSDPGAAIRYGFAARFRWLGASWSVPSQLAACIPGVHFLRFTSAPSRFWVCAWSASLHFLRHVSVSEWLTTVLLIH